MAADDRVCVDLCAGLGGFSRAFVAAGWEVITVDNDPKFHPIVCEDVTDPHTFYRIEDVLRLGKFEMYSKVVVLASPPCQSFSKANRKWLDGLERGLLVAAGCARIVREIINLTDGYFCIENPDSRLKWFMGNPPSTVKLRNYGYATWKPTSLWHNIPFELLGGDALPQGKHHTQKRNIWISDIERNVARRAAMPLGLSQAILDAVETH